jgi:hypothetical protein
LSLYTFLCCRVSLGSDKPFKFSHTISWPLGFYDSRYKVLFRN